MKNPDRVARFDSVSRNKKLSPVERVPYDHAVFKFRPTPRAPFCSSTWVSIHATCPDTCVFKRDAKGKPGGCFIDAEHFTGKAMARLDRAAQARGLQAREAILEEVVLVDGALRRWGWRVPQDGASGRGRDLRLHVGGDTPTAECAAMLARLAARWRASFGGDVWTYTHNWARIPAAAFGRVAVLASVELPKQVRAARRRGYAPALVVERFPNGKRPFVVADTVFIPCPAETVKKTCVECRLCLDTDALRERGQGIAFAVHGDDSALAALALVPLRVGKTSRAVLDTTVA